MRRENTFTSIGSRVELIQAFHNTAKRLGVDITKNTPALQFCNQVEIVCRILDENYIPVLPSIRKKEMVNCLITTIDTDLLFLAENKCKFE